jgi:hypothetical protein
VEKGSVRRTCNRQSSIWDAFLNCPGDAILLDTLVFDPFTNKAGHDEENSIVDKVCLSN